MRMGVLLLLLFKTTVRTKKHLRKSFVENLVNSALEVSEKGPGRTGQIFVYFAKKSVTSSLRQVRPVIFTKLQIHRRPASEQDKFLLRVKPDRFVNLHAMI